MKTSIFSGLLLLTTFCCGFAQAQQENVDTAAIRMIRAAEKTNSHIPMIAHYLTDVSGSRLTNSPGFFRAGNWAVETMKKWGLVNAKLEPWGDYGRGWEQEEFSVDMEVPYHQSFIGYAIPWTANTNGKIRAQVAILNPASMIDTNFMAKHAADYKGKIILLAGARAKIDGDFKPFSTRLTDSELMKMPDTYMIARKLIDYYMGQLKIQGESIQKLKAAGALALLSSNGRDGTVTVQAFTGYKGGGKEGLPEAAISGVDGLKLKRLIESGHTVELSLNIKGKFYSEDTKGYNVVAEIPGSDPKLKAQLVMLGGHMDSWPAGTGATDNGAGCIVMMEAVRLLDSLHLKPKRTIRIALWSAEEEGLLGSYAYVKNHFGNGETGVFKPEQAKISAYFNLDNGSGKIRGIFAQKNDAVKPIFEQWLVPFADMGAKTVTMSNTGSTDHLSFDWADIPGFQFIQDPLDYETKTHHTNMDTYDYLQIDDLKQAAVIVASFVYQAANRPEMLPRKAPVKEQFVFDGF
ncbi:M20/M25/M40 family metallo-hydrolase [Mucilaginibacter sp. BT774]|uniref:M20/M25/M40 family metallo-hydrolase n=1 Tax=Mucilaginibacter sp. BT774 TaxID=3062276 RepID=UPI002674CDC7|nr:M20/M25/M40 family metallo-hydrolase [Mucilaginibacter sp. BT774]MDO3624887.1 M20/M25/M40 family metallo-hydrolase [Mucilaginibacter sp. BT774]